MHPGISDCTHLIRYVIMGVLTAGNVKDGFENEEVLYGKEQVPSEGQKHTILLGQCQVALNREHPAINHCIAIKGCPPKKEAFVAALETAGIQVMDGFLEWMARSLETVHMKRYKGKPEFEEAFYRVE